MVYKQITFLYPKKIFWDMSPSSRYVVEGFFLYNLIKFTALYHRFKLILWKNPKIIKMIFFAIFPLNGIRTTPRASGELQIVSSEGAAGDLVGFFGAPQKTFGALWSGRWSCRAGATVLHGWLVGRLAGWWYSHTNMRTDTYRQTDIQTEIYTCMHTERYTERHMLY